MKITSEQIKKDVEYLTDLKISKDDINEILNHCEKSGLGSAQYFCEEFVFIPDGQEPEDVAKLHDPLYLDISEFNYLNWEETNDHKKQTLLDYPTQEFTSKS